MCQCPERGDPHFYTFVVPEGINLSDDVSMPWKGRPSFLLPRLWLYATYFVSMPWKGRPSFLHVRAVRWKVGTSSSVNALKGATLISTAIYATEKLAQMVCQCPERGDPHFYESTKQRIKHTVMFVSMPWKGRPSFLHLPLGTRINKGFADPFLQVFSRIFWKRRFWR